MPCVALSLPEFVVMKSCGQEWMSKGYSRAQNMLCSPWTWFYMEKSKSCVNSCNSFPGITLEASIFYDSRAINIQIYSYIFKFQLIVTNPGIYLKRINNDTVDCKNLKINTLVIVLSQIWKCMSSTISLQFIR
jgi:hypothetical protein